MRNIELFCRGRAPIASMDEMDMESMDILTGSNPTIQPDCNMLGKGVLPGLRYRHGQLAKSQGCQAPAPSGL